MRRMKIKRKSRVGTQKRRSIYLTAGVVITAVFAVLMFIGFIHTP